MCAFYWTCTFKLSVVIPKSGLLMLRGNAIIRSHCFVWIFFGIIVTYSSPFLCKFGIVFCKFQGCGPGGRLVRVFFSILGLLPAFWSWGALLSKMEYTSLNSSYNGFAAIGGGIVPFNNSFGDA